MRILLWHVRTSWTTAFIGGRHEYVLPVLPDRGPQGRGLSTDWEPSASITELSPAQLWGEQFDVLVAQRPEELGLAETWLGRAPGVALATVYVEHRLPADSPYGQRHPLADRTDIPIVHASHFNELVWDNGRAPTRVIEPGILDPGPRYSGEIGAGAMVFDEPGRSTGADLIPRFATVGPLDLFGAAARELAAAMASPGTVTAQAPPAWDDMLWELARRRVYLQPARWGSIQPAMIEAMQIGMPVLALATAAVSELIPADAGVVSSDVERLRREFRMLLNEPEIARFMGRQGRRAALARFGLARFLIEWDAVLAELVA